MNADRPSQIIRRSNATPSGSLALVATEPSTFFLVPRLLTPFIGRATELMVIVNRLQSPGVRLLTLTGLGGIGKTRLAIAAAQRLSEEAWDGIAFVPLVAATSAEQVAQALARMLEVRETGRSIAQDLEQAIGHLHILLVLDNLEQIPDLAPLLAHLLGACPALVILATSRAIVQVSGEHEYIVPPMALPDQVGATDATALFLERAHALAGDTHGGLPTDAVASICHRLDGVPLALELAAARLKVLTPSDLLHRLSSSLDLLTGGAIDRPLHQRTMRGTIAWSYDLLSPVEQACLRALSIFDGGCTVATASAVFDLETGPDTIALLGSLIDHSLLIPIGDDAADPRFLMLSTIREFGREQLRLHGEFDVVRERLATSMLTFARQASGHVTGRESRQWLDRLEAERDNMRIVFTWFDESGDGARFVGLAAALQRFWITRTHYREAIGWFARAIELARAQDDRELLVRALLGAGWIALRRGDGERAERCGDEALMIVRLLDDRRLLARTLELASAAARRASRNEDALTFLAEALSCNRAENDRDGIAETLHQVALVTTNLGRPGEACSIYPDAIAAYDAVEDARGAAIAHDSFSIALYSLGDFAQAADEAARAVQVLRFEGDKRALAVALGHVGKSASHLGDYPRAWTAHAECLPLRQEIGDARGLAVWLEGIASLLARCRHPLEAATILGATTVARKDAQAPFYGNELLDHERTLGVLRSQLSPGDLASAIDAGQSRSIDGLIAEACRTLPGIVENHAPVSTMVAGAPVAEEMTAAKRWGLTARETDMIPFIVARKSDREIAEELFISRYTVSRHVASILRKLNVHSRHAAARILDGSSDR